jgi:hypothetical protein
LYINGVALVGTNNFTTVLGDLVSFRLTHRNNVCAVQVFKNNVFQFTETFTAAQPTSMPGNTTYFGTLFNGTYHTGGHVTFLGAT